MKLGPDTPQFGYIWNKKREARRRRRGETLINCFNLLFRIILLLFAFVLFFNLHINTIYSLNVRGIRDQPKRRSIFLYLKDQKSKIYFLQDTYSQPEDGKRSWEVKYYYLTEPGIVKVLAIVYTLRYKIRSITRSVTKLEELC